LTLSGASLLPGATFSLKTEDGTAAPVEGCELERRGDSTLRVSVPVQALSEGAYTLEVRNPGGLSAAIPRALLIRQMFFPPVILEPAPGTAFGPSELGIMKSLRFSWKPVPGATRYAITITKAGAPQPLLKVQSLTDTTYVLDDLRVLDKGELSWTIEAIGFDELYGEIRSVKPGEARFTIDLPSIVTPAIEEGDVFYGR
jgi:hypothetical protein